MTPEEYERIKEEEKAHLRKLKELKNAVRQLERRKSVTQALETMATGSQDTLDVHEEMVEKLAIETAQQEARLEIALENQAQEEEAARSDEAMEDALLEARAKRLLQQMKLQMGAAEAPEKATPDAPGATPKQAPDTPEQTEPPPEKTIGRMR